MIDLEMNGEKQAEYFLETEGDPRKRYPVIVTRLLEGKLEASEDNLKRYIAAGRAWIKEIARRKIPQEKILIPLLVYDQEKDGKYTTIESPWGRPNEIKKHFDALEVLLDDAGKQNKSEKLGAALAPFREDLDRNKHWKQELESSVPTDLPIHASPSTRTFEARMQGRVPPHLLMRIESTGKIIQSIQNLAAPQK